MLKWLSVLNSYDEDTLTIISPPPFPYIFILTHACPLAHQHIHNICRWGSRRVSSHFWGLFSYFRNNCAAYVYTPHYSGYLKYTTYMTICVLSELQDNMIHSWFPEFTFSQLETAISNWVPNWEFYKSKQVRKYLFAKICRQITAELRNLLVL